MKYIISLLLVAVLAACGGGAARPPLPEGVTCTDEELATVNEVPAKANPDSPEYNEVYAVSWYMGHGCDGELPL